MIADLDRLAQSLVGPAAGRFAFCGIGIATAGATRFHTAAAAGIVASKHSYWRAASITKIITGRVAFEVFKNTGQLDATAEDILGVPFRTPNGAPPTVAQLASHQSGVTDAAGYLIEPDTDITDWLAQRGAAIWSGAAPGAQFEYSNLGFIVLAACAERLGGRFDDLVQRVLLGPMGVDASLNWSRDTLPPSILPTHRREPDGRFVAQIDAPPVRALLPPAYVAGTRPQAFSPQGGLRISLAESLTLASALKDHPRSHGWVAEPARMLGPPQLFQSYAWGAQILDEPTFYPRPLIGHFANAYGFCGGLWRDTEADLSFVYALNGLPMGDEDDGLRPEERAIFDAVAQAA